MARPALRRAWAEGRCRSCASAAAGLAGWSSGHPADDLDLIRRQVIQPSTTQRALIEQGVQIKLRSAVMDRLFAESGSMTAHDSRVYLAWANSLARLLRQRRRGGMTFLQAMSDPALARAGARIVRVGPLSLRLYLRRLVSTPLRRLC
jgi:hypothetical protein